MAKPIKKLAADSPMIIKDAQERLSMLQRWAALRFFSGVIAGNPHHPVDTGYSRANWNVSLGVPNLTHFPKVEGATYPPPVPPAIPPGNLEPVFVSNTVNYVQWLEEGTSQQAPLGFIRIQLEQTRAELESVGVKAMRTHKMPSKRVP